MERKIILIAGAVASAVTLTAFTVALNSTGKIFYTGSPYDGSTCADCHSGGSTIPTVTITANPAFGSGNTYSPSTTYTLSVVATGSYNKYGFDMEILNSNAPSGVADAGTFGSMLSGNCQKQAFANSPTNVTHTTPSGGSGTATFSYEWTAPASGNVFMYTAALGVNLNGTTTGDRVKTYSLALTADGTTVNEEAEAATAMNVFPNPASDKLTISYHLSARGHVQVALYTLSGEHVADLFAAQQRLGAYSSEVRIPAGLAKGAYLLKLFVNGSETTRKLLIM